MKTRKTIVLATLLATVGSAYARTYTFTSPDGRIEFAVLNDAKLEYSLKFDGKELIAPSQLGFELKYEQPMAGGFAVIDEPAVETGLKEEWKPVVRNKHKKVSLDYNRMVMRLRERENARRRMDLTIHLYNDGAAFRYTLYGGDRPCERLITEELTEFRVPATSFAWVGFNQGGGFEGSQESVFTKTPVTEIKSDAWCLSPLLVEVDRENYLAFTSAYLDNYPGFFTAYRNGAIVPRLVPSSAEREEGVKARFDHEFNTSWKVIFVGHNPGKFIESEIIHALNPPCAIEDTSWIEPGMSAWDHWWSGEVKMEMPVVKQYIDFASEMGWPYMLVDWQWYGPFNTPEADITKPAPQIDMPELIRYAKKKNVRLWLWLYCADATLNDAYVEAFKLYHEWGIAGVKIDFMDRYDREVVNWYRRVTAEAAKNELMVDYHGAFAPDGLDRTYPNQLTREGVKGEEYAKFGQEVTPNHNVTLAFTRLLAGHMDYTPGGFLNTTVEDHRCQAPAEVGNTRCHELAKFVVYDSPWCVFCDHPTNVVGQAGSEFVKVVPTEWDDTVFLGGYPDDYVAIAKRDGGKWYLGVLGGNEAREVELDLTALDCGKKFEIWTDGALPTELKHETVKLADRRLKVKLAPGGGCVAIIK